MLQMIYHTVGLRRRHVSQPRYAEARLGNTCQMIGTVDCVRDIDKPADAPCYYSQHSRVTRSPSLKNRIRGKQCPRRHRNTIGVS